jgi:type I restriction enzyme S subunit
MTEWKEYKLGEVVTFQRGHDLPKDKMVGGDIPVAGSNGVIGFHNEYTLEGPGVTIGRSGNIGIPHYYPNAYWAHNTVLYVKDFKGNNPKFIYYFLKTMDFTQLNTGSAVPSLNRNHIHELPVSVPSLDGQHRIASILTSLDDKIDLLRRENDTLEAMAETLFRQWFVVEAKEEWEEGKLGDILSVKGGTTPSTKEPSYWNGNIAWTSPRDVTTLNGLYLFDTEKKITQKGLEQISSGLLPEGTLLMSSRAPVGVLAFAEIPLAINQGYIAILDDKGYSKEFIYLWLKTNMDLVHNYSNGSTFMEISKSAFKSLDLSIPPQSKVEEFVGKVKPYFEKIRLNEIQIQTLIQTRDGLLPRLMGGEVKVGEK